MLRAALTVALVAGASLAILFRQAPPPESPRDRVVPATRPAPERIAALALGTSLTARALWPARLEPALGHCGFDGVDVTVRARPGATSAVGAALAASGPPAPYDVAFVEFAINDADILDGVSQAESLANHRAILRSLRASHPGIAIVLLTTNPVTGLHRFKRPKLMAYDDLYLRLADEEGVSLFDGAARWAATDSWREALPDGLHPDPAVEAALYARPLAGLIGRLFGRSCAP